MVARKTRGGQTIDMEALIAENESVRAVGNMMTNARGDQLNEKGDVVKTAQQIASESHVNQTVQTNQSIKEMGFTPEPGSKPQPEMVVPTTTTVESTTTPPVEQASEPVPEPKKTAPKKAAKPAPKPKKEEPKEVPEDDWQEQEVELEISSPPKEEWVEDPETGDFVPASELKKKE